MIDPDAPPPHDIIDRLFPACVTIGCIGTLIVIAIIGGVRAWLG